MKQLFVFNFYVYLMLLILAWLFICFFIVYAIGNGAKELLSLKGSESAITDQTFFLGLGICSLICSYLSLFTALNTSIFLLVLILSALSFVFYHRKNSKNWTSVLFHKDNRVWLVLFLLFSLIISTGFHVYDTGLYHSQSIQWIRTYPLVTGLGNLHGRLAFNTQFFPLTALFTFDYNSVLLYPINGIVLIVLSAKLIKGIQNSKSLAKHLFYITLLFFVCLFLLKRMSTPQADVICGSLIIYALVLLFERKDNSNRLNDVVIVFSLLLCPIFKLSTLPVLLLCCPVFFKLEKKQMAGLFLLGLMLFFPFFYKNYYLSGYLVYPFPSIDWFSPDWKIPYSKAFEEQVWIKSWAKVPEIHYEKVLKMPISEWLPIWFATKNLIWKALFIFNLLFSLTATYYFFKQHRRLLLLYFLLIFNVAFWFLTAPDPRFAYGILFSLSALTAFGSISLISFKGNGITAYSNLIAYGILLFVLVINVGILKEGLQKPSSLLIPIAAPTTDLKTHTTNFNYSSPIKGDQCFNAKIPCTPYPKERLVLRGENIKEGFKLQ